MDVEPSRMKFVERKIGITGDYENIAIADFYDVKKPDTTSE